MAMCWPKTPPCCKCAPNSVSTRRTWDRTSSASCSISKHRGPAIINLLAPLPNADRRRRRFAAIAAPDMGPARASRETSVKGPVGLLRLDTRSLDHLGPLCGFVGDELAEIGGRAPKPPAAHVREPGHYLRHRDGRGCVSAV